MFVTKRLHAMVSAGFLLAAFSFTGWATGRAGGLDNTPLPISIVSDDFNGDTYRDIALVNRSDNVVLVFLTNLDGTFAAPVPYPVGNGPVSVTTGDFNNDEVRDLVVANANSNELTILFGNGDGTFRLAGRVPVGNTPTHVFVEDFDD